MEKNQMKNNYETDQENFWAGEFGNDYIDRNIGSDLLASNLNFFSQFIIDFSKEMPFFYGLFTIMFAIVLGVSAAFIRRFVSNLRKNLLVKS